MTQLEIHAKAELYFGGAVHGGFDQNGERRSILQRTSVRTDEVLLVAIAINKTSCFFDLLRAAVSTPTPTAPTGAS